MGGSGNDSDMSEGDDAAEEGGEEPADREAAVSRAKVVAAAMKAEAKAGTSSGAASGQEQDWPRNLALNPLLSGIVNLSRIGTVIWAARAAVARLRQLPDSYPMHLLHAVEGLRCIWHRCIFADLAQGATRVGLGSQRLSRRHWGFRPTSSTSSSDNLLHGQGLLRRRWPSWTWSTTTMRRRPLVDASSAAAIPAWPCTGELAGIHCRTHYCIIQHLPQLNVRLGRRFGPHCALP